MKNKLVVCIMGQDCREFLKMSYEAIKQADAIVFCDGGSSDGTIEYLKEQGFKWPQECMGVPKKAIIHQTFDKLDKTMNGKQRNYYLSYLHKHYPNSWALCIDADEVVEDLDKIKEFTNKATEGLYSVKMRHFIGDLGHEDSTVKTHYVPNRLFKINKALAYPEVEHSVLQPLNNGFQGRTDCTTIWHLAYVPNLNSIKNRYEQHLLKSNMHTPQFLKSWYHAHLFGQYPKTPINPIEIPRPILDYYLINKDELYFANRGLETKHFIDAAHWKEFFKCKTAAEWGCGRGPRVYAMNAVGIKAHGWEISKWAVDHRMHKEVAKADITKHQMVNKADLVVAYDLLEHIPYNKLDDAIKHLIKSTKKYLLISVPTIGDPNLEADPTHIIKETKDWWIKAFKSKKLKEVPVPEHFLFKEQLLIFEK